MTFNRFSLDPRIGAGVQAAGFRDPTPIQEQTIPHILKGRDVLGVAQTGTGKTAAYVLPMLHRLRGASRRHVRALILAPTRELAEQIHEAIHELGHKTQVRSMTVYGGVSRNRQVALLRRGVQIVVACPGRLLDLLSDHSIDLSHIDVLVLDEADRMCDMGFLPDIRRILAKLPARRQTLFFSATMPKEIRHLASTILNDPVTVQIGMIAPVETVSHALYPVPRHLKKALLFATLEQTATGRVLIFTRTKYRARNLARDLARRKYRAAALQGDMSQNRRQQAINGFRSGKFDILVATDVASRGIDVEGISHVINFDMPDTVDAYTHRVGRTGRAHHTGEALTFIEPKDEPLVRQIEALMGAPLQRRRIAGFDYGRSMPQSQRGHSRGGRYAGRNGSSQSKQGHPRHSHRRTGTAGRTGHSTSQA